MAYGLLVTWAASRGHPETRAVLSSKEGRGRSATAVAPRLESELSVAQSPNGLVFLKD